MPRPWERCGQCWECDEAAQGPPPLCDRCVRAVRQCVQRGFRVHERGPARKRKALCALQEIARDFQRRLPLKI
jgi:hypothetical protein